MECQYQSDSDSELSSLQAASTSSSDMDTGIVVGVTDRVVKDIVASFQVQTVAMVTYCHGYRTIGSR